MLGGVDFWSIPRRALLRTSEVSFVGAVCDGFGVLPDFNEVFFGPYLPGYILVACALSMIYDILDILMRPDLDPASCVDEGPELPLEGGR
jgi:hypothetical protein